MLKATRLLEYVAFFSFKVNTGEGPCYIFFAVDAYTGYVFNLGYEPTNDATAALKSIYFLLEDAEFANDNTTGFTLVLDDYKAIFDKIEKVITPGNGKLLYDIKFVESVALPVIKSLTETFSKKEFD